MNNEKQILSLVKSQTYVLKIKCFFGLSSEKMDLIFATAWIYYWYHSWLCHRGEEFSGN